MSRPMPRISRWHDPDEEPPQLSSKRKEPDVSDITRKKEQVSNDEVRDDDDDEPDRKKPVLEQKITSESVEQTIKPLILKDESCRSADLYERLQKIGEGTYGAVYKARCRETNELVAMKRLKLENETEGFPQTSIRESITLLKGKHPNVINIREIVFGNRLDQIYIVMDFMDRDLRSLMKDMSRPFTIAEFKLLMTQLLSAIAHLHNNWIIHRDLKPSNLLIHKGILKVGDFGLAREYGSPLARYTNNVATLWYRAPELLFGFSYYSTPIDIWSVGCIFGELLTGRPIFEGQTEQQQIHFIFRALGSPTVNLWPDFFERPKKFDFHLSKYQYNTLMEKLSDERKKSLSKQGFHLWTRLLAYDPGIKTRESRPNQLLRITADKALEHEFFSEEPKPIHPSLFPTWPTHQTSRSQ